MNIVKKIIAVVLFLVGTILFAAALGLLKSANIGAGVFGLILALGAFVYPVLKIRDYVSQKKAYGQKWMALPAIAVSVPLLFGCLGIASSDTAKESKPTEVITETSTSETESTFSSISEETTELTLTPTPEPTETIAPTTTVTEDPTEQTTEQTTMATTEAATTTEAPTTASTTTETTEKTKDEAVVATEPKSTTTAKETSEERDYVANTNTKKFHNPNCPSVPKIKEKNREDRHCTREQLINEGYDPCGNCKP